MKNETTFIYPMMIELNGTIKATVHYLSFPQTVKRKWMELEKKSKPSFIPEQHNLPTRKLKDMFCRHLDGIVAMQEVKKLSDDKEWLISYKPINLNIVVNCFKIWIDEFYIKGDTNSGSDKRKRITGAQDDEVRRLAYELMELLTPENFEEPFCEEVVLFENGKAVHKSSYELYPLRLVDALIGKTLNIEGADTRLLYVSNKELITDPLDFHRDGDYYSFVIGFSVQTLPQDNRHFLKVDVSVRRWISRNKKTGNNFLPTNKKCYIRVDANRMQVMETIYDKRKKENVWKSIDARCFKVSQLSVCLPAFTEVLAEPAKFHQGKIGDILIPYQAGIPGIETQVESGVAFHHRETVFKFVKKAIQQLDAISSNVQAFQIRTKVQNRKVDIKESANFLKQLDKALNGEKLTIEIHAGSPMREELIGYLQTYFAEDEKHDIKCFDTEFYKPLDKTSMNKKDNLPGFEMRVQEIERDLPFVETPTLAIVAIHDKEYYDQLDWKFEVDPKDAIRCGFAKTGRLTQFITFEEFKKGEKELAESEEDVEEQSPSAKGKKNKVNRAIEGAVLDGFRQLGVVFDYGINKRLKGKKIVAVHICNKKMTKYRGNISPFPIILTYDVDESKVTVYSDVMHPAEVPYWKGHLLLAKLTRERNISNLNGKITAATIYKKLIQILQQDEKETLMIFDVNGSRKFINGISNKRIAEAEKNPFGYVEKLQVNDDLWIDFSKAKRDLSGPH